MLTVELVQKQLSVNLVCVACLLLNSPFVNGRSNFCRGNRLPCKDPSDCTKSNKIMKNCLFFWFFV